MLAGQGLKLSQDAVGGTGQHGRVQGFLGTEVLEDHRLADPDPVPLEYSIERLTCAVVSRLDAVMVG
jgi:hypothetical protein